MCTQPALKDTSADWTVGKKRKRGKRYSPGAEHLPSMQKVLGPSLISTEEEIEGQIA